VDSAWEQKKLEVRKMLENGAESRSSAARGVGQILQDGFEFEFDISMIHCIYRWAGFIMIAHNTQ